MKELMKKAAEFKMPAVAMTDHGNLFGAIEFYQEAQRAGIKPIIGCEAYIAPRSHKDRPTIAAGIGVSFHVAGRKRDRLSQSGQADHDRASRRISLRAADRQGAAGAALRGIDRTERLSRRRSQLRDSGKQHRKSKAERRRISRHSRRGKFLHRTARSRNGGAKDVQSPCCRRSRKISASAWLRQTMCIFCAEAITTRTT